MKLFFIILGKTLLFIPIVAWAETPRFDRIEGESGDWIVIDNKTHLEWQGCPAGLTGEICTKNEVKRLTWQGALEYCETLGYGGYDDWRLPNRRELFSIVDIGSDDPEIDKSKFPETPSFYFWSSSSYAGDSSTAWSVYFGNGHVHYKVKTSTYCARCVRGGP